MQSFDEKHSASKKKINKNVITIQAEYKKLKEIYVIVRNNSKRNRSRELATVIFDPQNHMA